MLDFLVFVFLRELEQMDVGVHAVEAEPGRRARQSFERAHSLLLAGAHDGELYFDE